MKRHLDFLFGVPLVCFLSLFKRKRERPSSIQKILVIKLAAAGDTILLLSVFQSLKATYPNAEIHWLVSPVNQALAETSSHVDRLFTLKSFGFSTLRKMIQQLKKEKYSVIVDLEQWARGTSLLTHLSCPAYAIGFDTPGQHRASLFDASYRKAFNQHEIQDFYSVFKLLGPISEQKEFHLNETEKGKEEVRSYLADGSSKKMRVLLHPGCGSDGLPREWPLPDYGLLAHWLMSAYNADIFITGGPEERHKAAGLFKLLKGRATDLGGRLSWQGIISLLNTMDLVVSGNTGVMHVAAALKKKQVALHGPTNPLLWGPLNDRAKVIEAKCEGCPSLRLGFEYSVKDQSCMKTIPLDQVKAAVTSLIDN